MLTENEMLQSMRFRSEVSLQITLDQDYNIPDNKADMEKMVVENGEVQIQNVKVMQDTTYQKEHLSELSELRASCGFAFIHQGRKLTGSEYR